MSASDMRGRNKEVRMSLRSSGLRCYPPAPLDRRRACFHIQLSSSRACAGRYVQVPSPLAGLGRGNCNGGALGTPSPALPHRKSGLPDLRKMKWRNRGKRRWRGGESTPSTQAAASRSRRRLARVSHEHRPSTRQRAQGKPGAQCTHSLACE